MNRIIKQRKWFWAWQDEQEETWLHEMSLKGLHLVKPQIGVYHFEPGEPKHYAYRLDFGDWNTNQQDYEQLFADAGWEHIGQLSGWQYFRKEAVLGSIPEIYTDNGSKIQKYRRLQWFLLLTGLPFLVISILTIEFDQSSVFRMATNIFLLVGFCGVAPLYGIALAKLEQRIRQLKRLLL